MRALACCGMMTMICAAASSQDVRPFIGRWALDLPDNGAGWLEVTQQNGYLDGAILWYAGSVEPLDSVYFDGGKLYVTKGDTVERKDAAGKIVRKQTFTDTAALTVSGDALTGTMVSPKRDGNGVEKAEFSGKRIPPLPPAPDLAKVKFGDPINLFNGKDLNGWRLTDPNAVSGWSVKDGILVNDPAQKPGQPHVEYGNLRTDKEFEDFNLKLSVNVPPKGNSGIYLRGIYEVQVCDSFGRPPESHTMGSIYSRIAPTVAAEKKPGEWQAFDITLVHRHVTVKLNGKTIIDNQPLLGCTGGALWSDEFRPGPIYLQGDHTAVQYKDIVLTSAIK